MFTHILIPVDGSDLSEKAVRNGVHFAKAIGARITAFHVTPKLRGASPVVGLFESTREEYQETAADEAKELLRFVCKTAHAAGVACDVTCVSGDDPFKEIIQAAERSGCDLILMASHGRRGVEGVLLGSETRKVLTHTRIPVLVYR